MAEEEAHNYRKPSILQQFASYSYYHILVACDSTQTADALSSNTEINRFKRFDFEHTAAFEPGQGGPLDGKYKVRNMAGSAVGGPVSGVTDQPKGKGSTQIPGGQYVTLIDGSVDADFLIKDVKWATVFAPDTKTADGETYVNTVELDGLMSIVEPNGVRFLDVISDVCDGLGTDPNGVVFLLKTIFVGHLDSGSTRTIATVRPLHFMIIDIEADFETSGASYSISFVGIQNGVGKLQPVVAISKLTNLNISTTDTLASALKTYFKNLNTQYERQLEAFSTQLGTTPKGMDEFYRLVEYEIVVDEFFDNFKVDDMENIRTHDKNGDPIVTAGSGGGIEEMISRIMGSSKEFVLLGTPKPVPAGQEPDPLIVFKILSRLESTPEKYIMQYEVVKYVAPVSKADAIIAGADIEPSDDQVMEFDYIFTGENRDILDFKINMNMGLAFFQTLLTTNNVSDQNTVTKGATPQASSLGPNAGSIVTSGNPNRRKTPLFLGMQIDTMIARNTKEPVAAVSFRDMMNRWAAFESLEASMTIAGNVELMDQTLKTAEEQARIRANRAGDEAFSFTGENADLAVAADVPNYVKINIRMPTTNSLYPQYTDFWYRGFYVLFAVNNIFEDGKFTQHLEMFSVPQIDQDKNGLDETGKPITVKEKTGDGGPSNDTSTTVEKQTPASLKDRENTRANQDKGRKA